MRTNIANHSTTSTGNRLRHRITLLVAVPLLIAVLAACQSNTGLSEEDVATITDQLEQVASRLDAVEERLLDLSQSSSDAPALLISEVRAATTDVGAAKTILADVTSQLEVSVPDETVEPTDDLMDEPVPDVDNNLQDLGNDIDNGIDNAGDAIDNGIDNAGDAIDNAIDNTRDTLNDGLDNARDTVDPLLDETEPNTPLPGNDLVPDDQDATPLGN